ncbi:hypothetical protein BXT86_01485 [candidate division WOR-3 bacterium 4484_100]|uniref:CRAL-TRIO domain-containing protein n=1 Tax=candidate division WOR-3 bacterium 4484_100 TaxID=1936077 RepID=A0A1V4QHA0_UNCW3|nr:MAG: hypothetical protein BXT86_01485 [candidate division WOR-3 bacterium 4484_100]
MMDRELTPDELEVLKTHIQHCPGCRMYYEEMCSINQKLFDLIEFYPNHNFNERVLRTLGFTKTFAWKRLATVFSLVWLASIISIFLIPWPKELMNLVLIRSPKILTVYENLSLIITSLFNLIKPFVHSLLNPGYIIPGLALSILLFYILGKEITKEARCSF